jgi:hypothetical protein
LVSILKNGYARVLFVKKYYKNQKQDIVLLALTDQEKMII